MLYVTCLLVSLDGVFEANHGSCAMISGALVLPDLMTFLMVVPSLMYVTGSVDVTFNALAGFIAILVAAAFLKVVLSGW